MTELQYRTVAIVKNMNVDPKVLQDTANQLRIKDFDDASLSDDQKNGFAPAELATKESSMTITTKIEGTEDQGVFRSKFKLIEASKINQDILLGKKVGDTFQINIDGKVHNGEVLAISAPLAKTEAATNNEIANEDKKASEA
jgi:hypothetical protein